MHRYYRGLNILNNTPQTTQKLTGVQRRGINARLFRAIRGQVIWNVTVTFLYLIRPFFKNLGVFFVFFVI